MLLKVISLSIKTGSASFFVRSSGRTALDMCYSFTRFHYRLRLQFPLYHSSLRQGCWKFLWITYRITGNLESFGVQQSAGCFYSTCYKENNLRICVCIFIIYFINWLIIRTLQKRRITDILFLLSVSLLR